MKYTGLLFLLLLSLKTSAQVSLAADVWPGNAASSPGSLTVYNGKLFFRATSAAYGFELWSYDGTSAVMEADIYTGAGDSYPNHLTVFDGKLYFQATDGSSGTELWSYDGSTATLEADIWPGSESSTPRDMTEYDGKLYFQAYDAVFGNELWSYNGSVALLEVDIYVGANNSSPVLFTLYNGKLFFNATDGSLNGQLWSYDGTTASLEASLFGVNNPLTYDGKLFFTATELTNGTDRELWSYDGTTATLEADIGQDIYGSIPTGLTEYDGKLFFSANDGVNGFELWSYDGASPTLEAEIWPGSNNGLGGGKKIVYGDKLYMIAESFTSGWELWGFDGDTANLVYDIALGNSSSYPDFLTLYDGKLYFQATSGTLGGTGRELWSFCSPHYYEYDSIIICSGDSYTFPDGYSQNITGQVVYSSVFSSVGGCDSIIETTVNVYPVYYQFENVDVCSGADYTFHDGSTQNDISSQLIHLSNMSTINGCDSVFETTIDIIPVDAIVVLSGDSLTATAGGATYQWIDCDNGNLPIGGETNQFFIATQNGNYSVIVTQNACLDTSQCVNVNITGVNDHFLEAGITVYPNPSKGIYIVQAEGIIEYKIYNTVGQLIESKKINVKTIDLSTQPSGIYTLQLLTENGRGTQKLVKH